MNYSIIIGIACLVVCIHKTPIYQRILQKLKWDRKPFNCVLCSTFWLALVVGLFTDPVNSIFISSTAAVLAEIIDIQIHKI